MGENEDETARVLRENMLCAVEEGDDEEINKLCARIKELRKSTDMFSEALYEAAMRGHIKIVDILLHFGADVNLKEKHFSTPLIAASEEGHTDTVKVLLAAGADCTEVSRWTGEDALTAAAHHGHLETVKALLVGGASVKSNARNARKDALVVSSGMGHTDIVKLLLTDGADKIDEALEYAIKKNTLNPEIAEMLCQSGASINRKVNKELPLMYAARLGYTKIAEIFLKYGAEINCLDDIWNHNALMVAVDRGHVDLSKVLLTWGADLDHSIPHSFIRCPPGIAVTYQRNIPAKSLMLMRILLLYGSDIRKADLTVLNYRDPVSTPLSIAMKAVEGSDNKNILNDYIMLLYAAGAIKNAPHLYLKYRTVIQKLLSQTPIPFPPNKLLFDKCRLQIRAHLMDYRGANQSNLVYAVSKLPLPKKLKRSLLLDIDISWMYKDIKDVNEEIPTQAQKPDDGIQHHFSPYDLFPTPEIIP